MRPLVEARSGGRCEVRFPGCTVWATEVHHRLLRKQGGTNDLANLLHICAACHRHGHMNPAEAYDRGFLVHAWDRPSAIPVIPFTDAA